MSGNFFNNSDNLFSQNLLFKDEQSSQKSSKENSKDEQKNPEEHPNTVEYKRIQEEIVQFKVNILENLKKMNFNQSEIQEVFKIIESHQIVTEIAKQPLIMIEEGQNVTDVENRVKTNVREVVNDMLYQLRNKVEEIRARKK